MKKIISAILVFALLTFCSCASYINESGGDSISPLDDSPSSLNTVSMPLYFRFYSEPLLARASASVETSLQHEPEYYAINALLAGPSGEREEIKSCFGKSTKLIETEGNEDYLNVTLSEGFLSDTKSGDSAETRLNRKLALYSIVNTVCEMGSFTAVQFFIQSESGTRRPDAFQMGMSANDDSTTLGPLTRDTSLIMTPSASAKLACAHFSAREWDSLYTFFADLPRATVTVPLLEEMTKKFEYDNLTVSEFDIEDNYTVSDDGKTAIVQISFKVHSAESSGVAVNDYPLALTLKHNCWLVSYESFLHALEVAV